MSRGKELIGERRINNKSGLAEKSIEKQLGTPITRLKDTSGEEIMIAEFVSPIPQLSDTTRKVDLGVIELSSLLVDEPTFSRPTGKQSTPCCRPPQPQPQPKTPTGYTCDSRRECPPKKPPSTKKPVCR